MRAQPQNAVPHAGRSLDVHFLRRAIVVEIHQAEELTEIFSGDGWASVGAAEQAQDLILVVAHEHPVRVDGDGGGTIAHASVPLAAWPARSRSGVRQDAHMEI